MIKNNCQIYKILLLSLVGVFLSGCSVLKPTPTQDQMDTSPFTGIPCAAPCWQGLRIGESSELDVMSTLSTLTYIDQATIQIYRGSRPTINLSTFSDGVQIIASCVQPSKKCLSVTVVDDILTEITLNLNYEIRVWEAIDYLGDPDYIGATNTGGEIIRCEVYLIWRDKQLVLVSGEHEGLSAFEKHCGVVWDTGKVSPDFLITEVRYISIPHLESQYPMTSEDFFEYLGMLEDE